LPDYEAVFSIYPNIFSVQVVNRENVDDSFAISIYAKQDRKVGAIVIGFHVNQRSPTIAELSNMLGKPTSIAVVATRAVTSYTLSFGDYACFGANTLPDSYNHTGFLQHPNSLHFCEGEDNALAWRLWRGFRSLEAYRR
jgi:hypothetical protein